jgi:hypothetical protein
VGHERGFEFWGAMQGGAGNSTGKGEGQDGLEGVLGGRDQWGGLEAGMVGGHGVQSPSPWAHDWGDGVEFNAISPKMHI